MMGECCTRCFTQYFYGRPGPAQGMEGEVTLLVL